jgi:ribosomal protein L11 methyltransferase
LGNREVVITVLPGSRAARLDLYCDYQRAQSLLKQFGGKVLLTKDVDWKRSLNGVSKPIPIRGQFTIYADQAAFDSHSSGTTPLFFPAEMAFGSGSHPSTASCLRLLCDLQTALGREWTMLDLGTGSGILAIAACNLGATAALGLDFDPVALRIARDNAQRNRSLIKGKTLRFKKMDLRENFPQGQYEVICANLFLDLLSKIVPRIFRSLKPRGWWIFSGVLARDREEMTRFVRQAGFIKLTIRQLGKWIYGIAQKPG